VSGVGQKLLFETPVAPLDAGHLATETLDRRNRSSQIDVSRKSNVELTAV
jgi:hypothetical protein